MSCEYARDLDLVEFLVEPGEVRWTAFRLHYPSCHECSLTLSRLTTMEHELTRVLAPAQSHPSPEQWLAYLEETAAGLRRDELSAHLDGCPDCRAELAAVRATEGLLAAAPAEEAAALEGEGLLGWLAGLLGGGRVLAPALVVLIVVGAALYAGLQSGPRDAAEAGRLVDRDATQSPRGVVPERLAAPAPPVDGEALAGVESSTTDPGASEQAVERDAPEAESGAPGGSDPMARGVQLADSDVRPPAEPDATMGAPEATLDPVDPVPLDASPAGGASETEREVVLLAMLDPGLIPAAPLQYRARAAIAGQDELGSGIRRSIDPGVDARVVALAPRDGFALTRSRTPTLFWAVERRARRQVHLAITPIGGIEPLLEHVVEAPVTAGLHAWSLADTPISLEVGSAYLFEVALVVDPLRRDRDEMSAAIVRVVEAPEVAGAIESGPREASAHVLAEAGLWLDAFASLEDLAQRLPDSSRVRAHRRTLLESAGLTDVAAWLSAEAP